MRLDFHQQNCSLVGCSQILPPRPNSGDSTLKLGNHQVRFSYGGTQRKPAIVKEISTRVLARADKWTRFPKHGPELEHRGYRLGDLFLIKRGIVTGANNFLILDEADARMLKLPDAICVPFYRSALYHWG